MGVAITKLTTWFKNRHSLAMFCCIYRESSDEADGRETSGRLKIKDVSFAVYSFSVKWNDFIDSVLSFLLLTQAHPEQNAKSQRTYIFPHLWQKTGCSLWSSRLCMKWNLAVFLLIISRRLFFLCHVFPGYACQINCVAVLQLLVAFIIQPNFEERKVTTHDRWAIWTFGVNTCEQGC